MEKSGGSVKMEHIGRKGGVGWETNWGALGQKFCKNIAGRAARKICRACGRAFCALIPPPTLAGLWWA